MLRCLQKAHQYDDKAGRLRRSRHNTSWWLRHSSPTQNWCLRFAFFWCLHSVKRRQLDNTTMRVFNFAYFSFKLEIRDRNVIRASCSFIHSKYRINKKQLSNSYINSALKQLWQCQDWLHTNTGNMFNLIFVRLYTYWKITIAYVNNAMIIKSTTKANIFPNP